MNRKKKQNNGYKALNEAFLVEMAQQEGVRELSSGVLCKKLEEGRGSICPKPSSIVYVRYTGRLIDGTVFDSCNGSLPSEPGANVSASSGEQLPALFQIRQLIMGWQIALTRMHEGDRWEIYIPAQWGYGSMKSGPIPAHSTLIFDLELIKIAQI